MNSAAITASVIRLIGDFGVRVTITSVDSGQSHKTTGAYATVKTDPLNAGASIEGQSKMYVAAGRFVPEVGDFVEVSGRSSRIKSVVAITLQGKPIVYTLEVT